MVEAFTHKLLMHTKALLTDNFLYFPLSRPTQITVSNTENKREEEEDSSQETKVQMTFFNYHMCLLPSLLGDREQ